MNDITLIANSRGISDNTVNQTGTASAKGYISVDDAKEAAFAHAGVNASDVVYVETDFDSEHGVMVYEVEFYAGNVEYEYDINAQSRRGREVRAAEHRYEPAFNERQRRLYR